MAASHGWLVMYLASRRRGVTKILRGVGWIVVADNRTDTS